MNCLVFFIILFCVNFHTTFGLDPEELTFIIISQPNKFNSNLANKLRQSLIQQTNEISKNQTNLILTHEDFPEIEGSWTIFPILNILKENFLQNSTKWIIFCDDHSEINLKILLRNLKTEKRKFLSYPLHDREATIIHHFAYHENPKEFLYPLISAGLIISKDFFLNLNDRVYNDEMISEKDFSIDASHEFAQFVWDDGKGSMISAAKYLCSNFLDKNDECAIRDTGYPDCGAPVPIENIIFGVKTCEKFHHERMPIVLKTWGQYAKHVRYYSDVEDKSIPTINIGVENTEHGHCEKSLKILEKLYEEIKELPHIKWIVLADDDTILSIFRLSKLLACYKDELNVYLGERYGFNLGGAFKQGFNYITGGGGIVFNRLTVKTLINNCFCPTIDSPDDMIFGSCLTKLNIKSIHTNLFHQARSNDYPPEILYNKDVISFHKFWIIDPYKVYKKWFQEDDRKLILDENCEKHEEL